MNKPRVKWCGGRVQLWLCTGRDWTKIQDRFTRYVYVGHGATPYEAWRNYSIGSKNNACNA